MLSVFTSTTALGSCILFSAVAQKFMSFLTLLQMAWPEKQWKTVCAQKKDKKKNHLADKHNCTTGCPSTKVAVHVSASPPHSHSRFLFVPVCVCVLIVNYYCNFHCSLHELQLLSSSATMKHTFRIFNFLFTFTLNHVKRNLNWDIIKRNVCWDNRQVISQAQATNGRWARCVALDFQKSYKEVKIKLFWKCLFCERSVLLWSELGVDSLHGAFQYQVAHVN